MLGKLQMHGMQADSVVAENFSNYILPKTEKIKFFESASTK